MLVWSLSKFPFREPGDLEVTYFLYEVREPRTRRVIQCVYKNCKIQVSQPSSKGCHSHRVCFGNFGKHVFASIKVFSFLGWCTKVTGEKLLRRKVCFGVINKLCEQHGVERRHTNNSYVGRWTSNHLCTSLDSSLCTLNQKEKWIMEKQQNCDIHAAGCYICLLWWKDS